MKKRAPRALPMVRGGRVATGVGGERLGGEGSEPGSAQWVGLEPDPARLEAGWQHRFVAEGERANEMIRLYRELGFEVAADPVRTSDEQDVCSVCFAETRQSYRSIYTRRVSLDGACRRL